VLAGLAPQGGYWSEVDSLLAQAWSEVERMLCPDCGTPLWQAFDPALEMKWVVDLPTRCHPCTAIARRAKDYSETDHPHALRFGAHLRT
jgi:hypothetical protein